MDRKKHQNVFVASKITFSHLVVTSIVDINTGVIFKPQHFQCVNNSILKAMQSRRLCHLPAKHECYVLQDSVETLLRRDRKRLHRVMANLIGKICIKHYHNKLYQNRPRFVKDMTKTFWCFFGSQSLLLFTCKIRMLSFTVETLFR